MGFDVVLAFVDVSGLTVVDFVVVCGFRDEEGFGVVVGLDVG